MKFLEFTQYLEKIEQTSGRLAMTDILAEMLKKCDPKEDEAIKAVYLIQGRVAPQYEPIEFSFSEKMIMRALIKETGKPSEIILSAFKKSGDIGLIIEELSLVDRQSSQSISWVFDKLTEIPSITGTNAQSYKEKIYLEIFKSVSNIELKFINRILTGNLRLGLSSKTILDALAIITGDKKNREIIESAYGVRTDLGFIAETVLEKGLAGLYNIKVQAGVPIAAKLVEREKNVDDIFKRLPISIIQPKLDGLRVHVHYKRSGFEKAVIKQEIGFFADNEIHTVRLYSRNMENLTDMFPDLVRAVNELGEKTKSESFIIDNEAIGIDTKNGTFLPFQETIKRKRKYDVSEMSESHPVKLFAFDIMELNGEDMLLKPTEQRVEILRKLLADSGNKGIEMMDSIRVETSEEIQKLFDKYVKQGLEGIIVKDVKSVYKPGNRNFDWIKLKAGSVEGLADSIDAVVLGYYVGSGVRTKFGIGAILVGTYDKTTGMYLSLAKVGTGFKDADWATIKTQLDALKQEKLPDNVVISDGLMPDVISRPQIVAEIEADSISKSKVHGGKEGYSLRFPRLKKFGRDKNPEDCTNVEEIKRMFDLQNK